MISDCAEMVHLKEENIQLQEQIEQLQSNLDVMRSVVLEADFLQNTPKAEVGRTSVDEALKQLRLSRQEHLDDINSEIELVGEYLLLEEKYEKIQKALADKFFEEPDAWEEKYKVLASSKLGKLQLAYWRFKSRLRDFFRRPRNGHRK